MGKLLYVSSTGNNNAGQNDCENILTPCNLAAGFGYVLSKVTPADGDIIYMCAGACDGAGSATIGTSFDSALYTVPAGTAWANALTIKPYPGETITINGQIRLGNASTASYVIFEGFKVDIAGVNANAILVVGGAHHIRFKDMEATGAVGISGIEVLYDTHHIEFLNMNSHHHGSSVLDHCMYLSDGAADILIEGGQYHHCWSSGIQVYSQVSQPLRTIVRNTRVYENGTGIILGGNDGLYYNNLVYNNNGVSAGGPGQTPPPFGGAGIGPGWGGSGNKAFNNTIYGHTDPNGYPYCILDVFGYGTPNSYAKNNICWGNFNNGIYADFTLENNLCSNCAFGAPDPLFTNEGALDFTLTDTSPALDTGQDLTSEGITLDILGVQRPQRGAFDIGAYELTGGGGGSGNVQTSRATEAFTGAAGDLTSPNWAQVGAVGEPTCRKDGSGRLTASATSQNGALARQTSGTFSNKLFASIKVVSLGSSTIGESFLGINLLDASGNGYGIGAYVFGSTIITFVGLFVNSIFTAFVPGGYSEAVAWAPDDIMTAEWDSADGHIWVMQNGVVVLNPYDTTYSSGLKPGVLVAGDALGDDGDFGDINFSGATPIINIQQPSNSHYPSLEPLLVYWTTQNVSGNVTIDISTETGEPWTNKATVAFDSSPYAMDISAYLGSFGTTVRVCKGSDCGVSGSFNIDRPPAGAYSSASQMTASIGE